MATFRLRRFAQVDVLKSIDPVRLTRFLQPYADYLAARDFTLPHSGGELDYERLIVVLMNPDESVPESMVDALYFVHELATPESMERLLSEARKRGIDLNLGRESTPADAAVSAWLSARELLEELHAEAAVLRPRSFEYHQGRDRRRRAFPAWDAKKLASIAERLDVWFIEHKRGDGSKVFIIPHDDKVYLLIRHGASMRREASITYGKRGVAYYRPEVHDVLVYDGTLDVLGLNAGTVGEKTIYREVFGEFLFGDREYFAKPYAWSLDPLLEYGPAILACNDVPGMNYVKLVEVRRYLGGQYKNREISRATDIFGVLGADWQKRLKSGKLSGATFEVTIGEGQTKRRRKVSITPKNLAKYDRDEDAAIIEAWLKRRGIMPEGVVDADVDPDNAGILDGLGGPARTGDRQSKLEDLLR